MIVKRGETRSYQSSRWLFVVFLKFAISAKGVVYAESTSLNENAIGCGGEYSGYQYTISSPNYPGPYPQKQNCVYTLRGSHLARCDQAFNLQFLDFSLSPSENCAEDYVEIGDRSLYCGKVVGIRRYSSIDNTLVLRFHSSAAHTDKGFKILVTTLPCTETQIHEKQRAESTEQGGTTLGNRVATKYIVNGNVGSQNEPESVSILAAVNSYPVYRPDIDFTVEDNRQFARGEVPSPPRVESLDANEPSILSKIQQNPSYTTNRYLANSLEIPVYRSKLFRESTTPIVEIVTPSSVLPIETKPSKISAYLFVPPIPEKYSKNNGPLGKFSTINFAENLSSIVTPPPTEILLPNRWNTIFHETAITNHSRNLPFVQYRPRSNEKIGMPVRSYGTPDQLYYPSFKGSNEDIKTGEVLENSRHIDCQGQINLEPDLEVTANFRGKNRFSIDKAGRVGQIGNTYYPARTYGTPASRCPSYAPNVNEDINISTKYGPPAGNYPIDNLPGFTGSVRPNDWLPSTNIPSKNFNDYPNFIPNVGISSGGTYPVPVNPINIGRHSECCSNVYSAQRFLLASPGFPSLSYNDNAYECFYAIRPQSPNICQLRFNFKFFNHGTEDRFCTYGHVEIDGRRICGCKKGLSVVSRVTGIFPKIIGVRYTGYPRTKFNGFLIEVIQERCSNVYPYLSRSKKDTGNSSRTNDESISNENPRISNNTLLRTRRNLGYSYPKPNFGLTEDSPLSQSWNSGSSINNHQLVNQGVVGGNLFSPLSACRAFSFYDWTIAAKETYLRNSRCVRTRVRPGYLPDNWNPGNGGTLPIIPGCPGNPGIIIPGSPSNGCPGTILPGYPGNAGPGNIIPGNPINGGTIIPGIPGNVDPGIIIPGYPSNGGSGTIAPGYPGGGGPGTIIPVNPGSGGWNFPSDKCEDVNVVEGIISSPRYPTNYPNNIRKCFRFYKAPDSCQLEFAFLDFDLENSAECTKDYVTFSGQNRRYCGRSLIGNKALFDIRQRNTVDVCFIADGFGSRRGFNAGFSQIPCRTLINR